VKLKPSRVFRNKGNEYLKENINQLETTSESKNIRDVYREDTNKSKKCQLRKR